MRGRSDYPSIKVVDTTNSPLFRLLPSSISYPASSQTMATTSTTIPCFLLPRLSWSPQVRSPLRSAASTIHVATQPSTTMSYTTRAFSRARNFPTATRVAFGQAAVQQRRPFSATPQRPRDHHFDTLKFVQRLKDEGFTEEQAVAMMKVLGDVVEER